MGGGDIDGLSTLIGDIYDTTLDAALWEQTLKKAAGFIGGSNAGLWSKDADEGSAGASHTWGFDPSYVRAYFNEYRRMDPAATPTFSPGLVKRSRYRRLFPSAKFSKAVTIASGCGRRA